MSGRRGTGRGRWLLTALLPALAWAGAGCGSSGPASETPSANVAVASPAALATPTTVATDRPNLPTAEVITVLEGRIAAMNRGDGAAAAAFYTEGGVMEETDQHPHIMSQGREEIAARFDDLYLMGLRLAPAGAPIANDRYVAEPMRFHNGYQPGRGAGMLVFEIGAGPRIAHQWVIGWAAGPEETFAIRESTSVDRPNLPPRRIMRVLGGYTAAVNRGDGQTAASYFAKDARTEELDHYPNVVSRGRRAIAAPIEDLHRTGLRLAAAGAPITYDAYVAQPVRFFNRDGAGQSAGMLVFQFDPTYKIAHEWFIGELEEAQDQAPTQGAVATPDGAGPGEIAFTKGMLSGDGLIQEEGIYLVHADGTGLAPLVPEAEARNPAWSPDGASIAYFDRGGVNVINADGSGKRFVTVAQAWGGWAGWLTWSPDGTQIAFTSYNGDTSDLYVVGADGSGRRQLTHGQSGSNVEHPAWAADGRIYFDRRAGDAGETRIYSMNADGTELTALRDVPGIGSFSLSANGKWLLVWEANGLMRVPACDPKPDEEVLVAFGIRQRIRPESTFALSSSWAPHGNRIVFGSDQQAWIAPSSLWVMDVDGRHLRKIPRTGLGWDPVWRPE